MADQISDYDYFITIINYLDFQCRLHFIIGSNDFDLIYNCWQKQIPLPIIFRAINKIVNRKRAQNKKISNFGAFSYQIKKEFKNYLESNIGLNEEGVIAKKSDSEDPWQDCQKLIEEKFPQLQALVLRIQCSWQSKNLLSLQENFEELLNQFANDLELQLRCELFQRSISSHQQCSLLLKRYRLSYLINLLKIPVDISQLNL